MQQSQSSKEQGAAQRRDLHGAHRVAVEAQLVNVRSALSGCEYIQAFARGGLAALVIDDPSFTRGDVYEAAVDDDIADGSLGIHGGQGPLAVCCSVPRRQYPASA